jgi:hypothetical protein
MQRKIIEYKLIYGETNIALSERVNAHIAQGFQPVGKFRKHGTQGFLQQMVKYAEEDN